MPQSPKRKVTFVTPTKSKKVVVSTPKKMIPVCISSLKTRGLHKILEYVKKVEFENVKLRDREKKLIDKLEKAKMKKSQEKVQFDKTVTEMADRILQEQSKAKSVISEKNNTLLAISESLSDLGQKLQEEKLNIEKEMVKQRKVIQRLKLRNNQLREKLQRKNSLKRKENERFVCDNKDDSGRESANNSSDTGELETGRREQDRKEYERKEIVCYWTCYL